MLMYHTLAPYYDALVKDEEATLAWVDLIEANCPKKHVAELACGSGEITIELARRGYDVHASDLSGEMVAQAKMKEGSEKVHWSVMDMCEMPEDKKYDGIFCLCDSFNYVLKKELIVGMFHRIYNALNEEGVYIFDMHSQDRIEEFEEEFCEAGYIGETAYEWSIKSEDDLIYQNFAFYIEEGRPVLEQHIQRVYKPEWVMEELNKIGFEIEVLTDFIHEGIVPGEKQFFICRKGKGSL